MAKVIKKAYLFKPIFEWMRCKFPSEHSFSCGEGQVEVNKGEFVMHPIQSLKC